jgi:hypothetical protein
MNINKIVTYSLLAHINDSHQGIKDLGEIYIPLVKRVLALLEIEGVKSGLIDQIKQKFNNEYGLNIPTPLLKKIMVRIASEVNDLGNSNFIVYKNDGAFIISNFSFKDFDFFMKDQQYEVEKMEKQYKNFLRQNNLDVSIEPSIFEYLDNNRNCLSAFFDNSSYDVCIEYDKYINQVRFINSIRLDRDSYNILKRVYLGSIISCYLEFDNLDICSSNIILLLDSNFIISLLDLHKPEDTETCKIILEISGKHKYSICVMDHTLQETTNLLDTKADNYENAGQEDLLNDDFYTSCIRKGYKRTKIQQLARNLKVELENIFGEKGCSFQFIKTNDRDAIRIKEGKIYNTLKERPYNKNGALHDAMAIDYIRSSRFKLGINKTKNFFDGCCWFITYDRSINRLLNSHNGGLGECISPDYLVSLLWLSYPGVNGRKLGNAGLTKLISNSIDNSINKAKVFTDLYDNIKRFETDKINEDDLASLACGVADNTITTLDIIEINEQPNKEAFFNTLSTKIKTVKKAEEEIKIKNEQLEVENEKLEVTNKEIIEKSEQLEAEILRQAKVAKGRNVGIFLQSIIDSKNSYLEISSVKEKDLRITIDSIMISSKKLVRRYIISLYFLLGIVIWLLLKNGHNLVLQIWPTFDNESSFFDIASSWVLLPYISIGAILALEDKFSIIKIKNYYVDSYAKKLYKKYKIDVDYIETYNKEKQRMDETILAMTYLKEEIDRNPEDYEVVLSSINIQNDEYIELSKVLEKIEFQ